MGIINPELMKDGATLIAEERKRQIAEEWHEPRADLRYTKDQLALAAIAYAIPERLRGPRNGRKYVKGVGLHRNGNWIPMWRYFWPWLIKWWKPTPDDRIRELTKAGALIAAEIDRLRSNAST